MSNSNGYTQHAPDTAFVVSEPTDLAVSGNDRMQSLLWMEADVESGLGQTQRGMEIMADGIVRVSVNLATIRAEELYLLRGDVPFEEYVQQRFGLHARTLRQYLTSYENLGRQGDLYGRLLRDMGVKRTYALSIIREMAPDVFAEFQVLPIAEQQATHEQDLKGIIAQLKAERAQVLVDHETLATTVRKIQQELAAERGSKERLAELEAQHRKDVGVFVRERDEAKRGWDQEMTRTTKLEADLQHARQEQTRLQALLAAQRATQNHAAPDHARPNGAHPGVVQITTMAVPCDVRSLTVDIDALVKKLGPVATMEPTSLTPDEKRELMAALQRLGRSLRNLGVVDAPEGGG